MDARDYVFPQHALDGASRAFGRLLDRISDRIFPFPSPAPASSWTKYGVTFLGALVWSIYGTIWTTRRFFPPISLSHEDGILTDTPVLWSILIQGSYAVLSGLSLIIVLLIGRSFDRGRPLTFFFWGLIFPTAALTLLRLAFPDLPVEAQKTPP